MTNKTKPKRRYRRWLIWTAGAFAFVFAVLAAGVFYWATNGVQAPGWAKSRVISQINSSLPGMSVRLGELTLTLEKSRLNPRVTVSEVEILDSGGVQIAYLPEVVTELHGRDVLKGQLRPVNLHVNQASVSLVRDQEGNLSIRFAETIEDQPENAEDTNLGDILSIVENTFDLPVLSRLEKVESSGTSLFLIDEVTGRNWSFSDGILNVDNAEDGLVGSMGISLLQKDQAPATVTISWNKPRNDELSAISTRFSGFSAVDVADQVAALDWLRILNAPISGAFSVNVSRDGVFGDMSGVLDIGAGRVGPGTETAAALFDGAKAYLQYDSANKKLTFDEITLNTGIATISAQGQAYLSGPSDRSVDTVVGQFRFSEINLNPDGVFESPLTFENGFLDTRLRLDPLVVDVGQLVLIDGQTNMNLSGQMSVTDAGWESSLDLNINQVNRDQVVQMWPTIFKPKTRKWIKKNVHAGLITNAVGAFRAVSGEKPRLNVGFDISDANFSFMKTMPVAQNTSGYGILTQQDLTLVIEEGVVTAPLGGLVNVAGTSLFIPDITIKNAPAEVSLKTQSSITAAMSLLDLKPFEFMSKAGLEVDMASGTVETGGTIKLPLSEKVKLNQVSLDIGGRLVNVATDRLVKNKFLRAGELKLIADSDGIVLSGPATLGATPITGSWVQKFGPQNKGKSRVDATIELSKRFLDEFGIVLPKGSVKGVGFATAEIDLQVGRPPEFKLRSDLNRVALRLDALGWKKPKNATGRLLVRGVMSDPMLINVLEIRASGLDVDGNVKLNKDGTLDVARLSRFDLDGWMETPLDIKKDSNGNLSFFLKGGRVDFRKSTFGDSSGAGDTTHIGVLLDDLILSGGIRLTDLEGDLAAGNGVSGSFTARVNGGARIAGTLAPLENGVGVRFTSTDAGAVMKSSGVFTTARDGKFDMVLIPTKKSGHYAGDLTITNTRVVNASALAELLSLISVVGLIEKLSNEGIMFSNVDAEFVMSPTAINLKSGSAIGASFGMTMEGVYEFGKSEMDMQGEFTPLYLLNGLLEQSKVFGGLFGEKKGEGLFGFTYTLKGKIDDPKVAVNPLSVLTPGFLRKIFKKKKPEPSE